MKFLGLIREFSSIIFNKPSGADVEIRPENKANDGDAEQILVIPDTIDSNSDTLALLNTAQTLTNKELTSPTLNGGAALTVDSTELNQLDGVSVGGSGAGDLVTLAGTQTLSNKTLTSPRVNLIFNNAATSNFTLPNFTGADVLISRDSSDLGANALTNKELVSNNVLLIDGTDITKKAVFNLASITTSTTRFITLPDLTGTLALTAGAQTLTDKTINASNNTISNIGNSELLAGINADKIANASVDNTEFQRLGTVGVDADGELVSRNSTQTLSNKTITAAANTISGLTDSNLAASGTSNIAFNKLAATTANVALETDASGYLVASAVTSTELNYLDGVSSSIQTQLDDKSSRDLDNLTIPSLAAEDLLVGASATSVTRLGVGLNGQVLTISGGAVTWDNPAGTGDVVGPGSSTDNALVRFDLETGKVLQNSGVILNDLNDLSGINDLNAGSNTLFADASTSRVGVGTASPTYKLHVRSGVASAPTSGNAATLLLENSANAGLTIASSNTGAGSIYFTANGKAVFEGFIEYNQNTDVLRFGAGAGERMTLNGTGALTATGTVTGADLVGDWLTQPTLVDANKSVTSGNSVFHPAPTIDAGTTVTVDSGGYLVTGPIIVNGTLTIHGTHRVL